MGKNQLKYVLEMRIVVFERIEARRRKGVAVEG